MQGGTEKSENIRGGHFDFNSLQGGKTISQILQALHTAGKITFKKLQA